MSDDLLIRQCSECDRISAPIGDLMAAAEDYRQGRIRYAEAFLRHRARAASDGQAHQRAIVETQDELTILEAKLELARRALDRS